MCDKTPVKYYIFMVSFKMLSEVQMLRSFIVINASFRFCLVLRIPTYEEIVADDEEVLFYGQRSHLGKKSHPHPRKNAQSSSTLAVVSFSTVDNIEILYPKKPSTLKNDVINIDFG